VRGPDSYLAELFVLWCFCMLWLFLVK
jgi:hypothetical protein